MKKIKHKKEFVKYRLKWYHGSLDFPCDFCDSNSYQNYHIERDGKLIVVCEKCLKEVKKTGSEVE